MSLSRKEGKVVNSSGRTSRGKRAVRSLTGNDGGHMFLNRLKTT